MHRHLLPGLQVSLDDPEFRRQFNQMAVAGNFLYFNIPWYGVYRMPKYGGEVYPIEEAKGVVNSLGLFAERFSVLVEVEPAVRTAARATAERYALTSLDTAWEALLEGCLMRYGVQKTN
jgi:hypothetical protein